MVSVPSDQVCCFITLQVLLQALSTNAGAKRALPKSSVLASSNLLLDTDHTQLAGMRLFERDEDPPRERNKVLEAVRMCAQQHDPKRPT